MKIGIHHTKGSFSDRWIDYCESRGIDYKLVDCFESDIVHQLSDCDALMWHYNHKGAKESKFAKQLLFSLEAAGKKVFPDFNTAWHFDDKVGQKYLLEASGVPLAPSYVFYSKSEARDWANRTDYPKVFKLRNGAGSDNVRLVNSRKEANRLINRAFGSGFNQYASWRNLMERYRKYRLGIGSFWNVLKGIVRLVHTTEYARITGREKGYIYFQDFIPGNDHDIRIVVVGERAFAIKRMVRENDFRASGSGFVYFERELFSEETVRMAFEVSEKLGFQCMAYDFVHLDGSPQIVEISYGFAQEPYDACEGYWDRALKWHPEKIAPQQWMVDLILSDE